jgi:hypothetical protein
MAATRPVPRPFEMHWGSGEIVEEACFRGEYHESVIQLLEYRDGEAAGGFSIRFCTYSDRGRFSRSPLMVSAGDLDGLRIALHATPKLRALLQQLVG